MSDEQRANVRFKKGLLFAGLVFSRVVRLGERGQKEAAEQNRDGEQQHQGSPQFHKSATLNRRNLQPIGLAVFRAQHAGGIQTGVSGRQLQNQNVQGRLSMLDLEIQ
jgi:hypothetical protein